jgi:hypothetical protein
VVIVAIAAVAAIALSSLLVVRFHTASRSSGPDGGGGSDAPAAGPLGPGAGTASGSPSTGSSAGLSAGPSGSTSPGASAKPPSSTGFPDGSNTGVPAGTKLAAYSGPCTITADNAVIDSKLVNCGTLEIRATGAIIRKSKINGLLVTTERAGFSFTLEDSEVDAGVNQRAAVGSTNMTILRSNIHGGQTAVVCAAKCNIRDSWLHGQRLPAGSDWHLGGFLANDPGANGRTDAVLVHNTIVCDSPQNSAGGGCSGNINLFADFGPVSYVTAENNLLGANTDISYCVYGGSSTGKEHTGGVSNIVFVNNVLRRGTNRKCGFYGPVTSFDPSRPGNRWENNVWDDGTPVESAN